MYAQRVDSNGIVRWTAEGVTLTNYNSAPKLHPRAVSDGKGGVITAWLDNRPNYGVYAGKVDSSGKVVTGISQGNDFVIPENLILYQNYPNPFNPNTTISYSLPERGLVKVSVFDILGREVTVLVNEVKERGNYTITFDGHNLSSGVYVCTLAVNDYKASTKLILAK